MGRKRRSTHNSKRTLATRSFGRPTKLHHNAMQRIPFMDLPPEIRDAIVADLSIHDVAILVRTSKSVQAYLEPRLYNKMYTRINTAHNTTGLVELLQRRTHIAPLIQTLVLDEYHPCHTRRLLSIGMPNLWCLLVQHEGGPIEYVSEREKRALNRSMVELPKLSKVVFWTAEPLTLSRQNVCLFRQPNLERLRFSYINFSPFEDVSDRCLNCAGLKILFIEESTYTSDTLKQLITSSHSLTSITINQRKGPLLFHESQLLPILSHAAGTLKVLKLRWTDEFDTERQYGFNLSNFKALRLLRIESGLLLGPHRGLETYTTPESPNLAELVRSRLPPNVKQLLLGCTNLPESRPGHEIERIIYDKDLELMRCLLEQRESVAPKLTRLFMYHLCNMYEPHPTHLYDLAERVGVMISERYAYDDLEEVDWKWLDSDEDP